MCAPGTEAIAAHEAKRALPDATVTLTDGGVDLVGPSSLVMRANLLLRLPARVLLRFGDISARDFGKLEQGLEKLPWSTVLPHGSALSIRAAAQRCRLFHTGAIAERLANATNMAIGATVSAKTDDATLPLQVLIRGQKDEFTVSIDTSGALLHRRGWRLEGGEAPLRETLAAALLALAEHAPDEPLCDPMCGSGTLVIEAALAAIGRAPGIARSFAFERFVSFDAARWTALCEAARASESPRALALVAADADEAQLEVARRNAARAGVAELIDFRCVSLGQLKPPAERGLVVTNPPYGKRIGAHGGAPLRELYNELGRALKGAFARWRAAVVVEDQRMLAPLGLSARGAHVLPNGGLRVWVGRR